MSNTESELEMGRTSIQVSDELADELYDRKQRGESYEDVIWRLIDKADNSSTQSTPGDHRDHNSTEDESSSSHDEHDTDASAVLEDVEFPQSKDHADCVEAVNAARAYLEQEGTATLRDFVRDVMPNHSLGYNVPELEPGDRYRGAWWRRVVKPGLQAFDDVESPPPGASEWRWVG